MWNLQSQMGDRVGGLVGGRMGGQVGGWVDQVEVRLTLALVRVEVDTCNT